MRSQIFAGLALGVVAMVSGAPVESSASSEPVSITAATFIRRDGNQNGNWDTITHLGFGLETPVTTVHCEGNTFPDPAIPSNVYACDDPAYSFQITDRPGYSLYAITVTHKVSDSVTLAGVLNVGCNGPTPIACSQSRASTGTLTAA